MTNPKVITRHPITVFGGPGAWRARCDSLQLERSHRRKDMAIKQLELAIMATKAEGGRVK